ncbi:signal peptidase II [Nocardioides convexus]|uniref:signal peptidase II n=1 Tax=Nocardioides convexus TaxID=2712224 RepID=UPI002418316D|nr:signal peptidase II [Nocardioides convexus]
MSEPAESARRHRARSIDRPTLRQPSRLASRERQCRCRKAPGRWQQAPPAACGRGRRGHRSGRQGTGRGPPQRHPPSTWGCCRLRLAHNSGVAFSLGDALPTSVVAALTAAITAVIALYGWRHAPTASRIQVLAGAAIIGGASANVIDRARDGVVTDYLHTGWWPTFNLADTVLVIGGAVLVLSQTRPEQKHASDAAAASDKYPAGGNTAEN